MRTGRTTATIHHEEGSQKLTSHPLPCLERDSSPHLRIGRVSLPVILLHHLFPPSLSRELREHLRLQCVTLATDTNMHTIGDTFDQGALLTISYSTFQKGMCHKILSACPKWAMFRERLSAGCVARKKLICERGRKHTQVCSFLMHL